MIYIDPTEARQGTKLARFVLDRAKILDGLEEATGADVLVTNTVVPGGTVKRPPGSILLRGACEGAFLVQRKSGNDLLHSIPNLGNIVSRMREWPAHCWLVYSGHFDHDRSNDRVVHEGRETNWHWNALQGALDAWQIRGGCVHREEDDHGLGEWLVRLEEVWLNRLGDEKLVRDVRDTSHLRVDEYPWRSVLEGFPGVGSEMSRRIADHTGSLKMALWWMSTSKTDLDGVGEATKEKWRKWMGLEDGEELIPIAESKARTEELIRRLYGE